MAKAKIFIASSYRALNLAQQLAHALSADFAHPVVWIEESERIRGAQTIIEMLETAGKTYDFAVIVLTRDDEIFKKIDEEDNKKQIKARDNCIFEAGLFFGTIGRDNCYLLSSIPKNDLPADLGGIIYTPFNEPNDFGDYTECAEVIKERALEIKTTIQREWKRMQEERESKKPTFSFPVVSREQMFEWETCEAGGRIDEAQPIVVNATRPFETKYKFACRVRQNIERNVNYYYFFQADEDGAQNISCLLQMILLAGLLEDLELADVPKYRENMITKEQDKVLESLKNLRETERLSIYFLPDEPAFEFCLHNATHPTKAKAFIKIDKDHFIEWSEGSNAHQIWKNLKNWIPDAVPPGIFHSTRLCRLSGAEEAKFKAQLDKQLKIYFPKIHEEVKKLCYEDQE